MLSVFVCLAALLASSRITTATTELRIAIAPKINLPKDCPVFTEENTNFFGTNIALLTSKFLRTRAETQMHVALPASLHAAANRIADTSIISVTASGADEKTAGAFLSALFDQFIRYKREQKEKYYRDAIARTDFALASVPEDYVAALKKYREQLLIASLLDNKPEFERIDY